MQINEDGNQLRDFVSVRDVARAHRLVLENDQANFRSFNVGSGQATKIIDLAKIVAAEAGVGFQPALSGTYRVGDGRNSRMNVEKLMALGWQPQVSLREAVQEYLTWIKQQGDVKQYLEETYARLRQEGVLKS
jgi:dTDP-L-rhamnose 4-epimerase